MASTSSRSMFLRGCFCAVLVLLCVSVGRSFGRELQDKELLPEEIQAFLGELEDFAVATVEPAKLAQTKPFVPTEYGGDAFDQSSPDFAVHIAAFSGESEDFPTGEDPGGRFSPFEPSPSKKSHQCPVMKFLKRAMSSVSWGLKAMESSDSEEAEPAAGFPSRMGLFTDFSVPDFASSLKDRVVASSRGIARNGKDVANSFSTDGSSSPLNGNDLDNGQGASVDSATDESREGPASWKQAQRGWERFHLVREEIASAERTFVGIFSGLWKALNRERHFM